MKKETFPPEGVALPAPIWAKYQKENTYMTGTSRACIHYTQLSRELQEPAPFPGAGLAVDAKTPGLAVH